LNLGKGNKTQDYMKNLEAEGEIVADVRKSLPKSGAAPSVSTKKESIEVLIDEKITAVMEKDGGVKSLEIKGDLTITISDPLFSKVQFILASSLDKNFQYRTHPNIDKKKFSDNIIVLQNLTKGFPPNSPLGVLKWRFGGKDDSSVPFSVSCWPSVGSEGTTVVNMEYELINEALELHDVSIGIPFPGNHAPVVNSGDGDYKHEKGVLRWNLPLIDSSNSNGSMEFTIPWRGDSSAFFPLNITFSSPKNFAKIHVETVTKTDNGQSCPYSQISRLSTDRYVVEN
jgi:hypothetical protein